MCVVPSPIKYTHHPPSTTKNFKKRLPLVPRAPDETQRWDGAEDSLVRAAIMDGGVA